MKPNKMLILILIFILISLCCDTTEPPNPPPPPIEQPILILELDDAHCTEVWIMLKTEKLTLPAELKLKQYNPNGDSISQIFLLNTKDSLLYIDSLLPNKSYQYQLSSINSSGVEQVSSNKLNVATMDTTSHNFTFEMITFGGEIGSSVLYDVAIINENNIWAVGDIWIKSDTSSTGYIRYNAVHWDGNEWKLHRIMFYTVCGQSNLTPYPARSVFAFNENDVWIAMDGDQIARMEGENQISIQCLPVSFSIFKLWGSSNNNLYAVGYGGNILHYNGTSWSWIASGTILNINDIWGDYSPKTNEWEVLAVASNRRSLNDRELLKLENQMVKKIQLEPRVWPLVSVWFTSQRAYYLAGQGIYYKHWFKDKKEWKDLAEGLTTFSTTSVRGNNINDIVAVGAFGDFLHFNGMSWKQYQEPYLNNGAYAKVTVKGNLVVAIGGNQVSLASEAVILLGRR